MTSGRHYSLSGSQGVLIILICDSLMVFISSAYIFVQYPLQLHTKLVLFNIIGVFQIFLFPNFHSRQIWIFKNVACLSHLHYNIYCLLKSFVLSYRSFVTKECVVCTEVWRPNWSGLPQRRLSSWRWTTWWETSSCKRTALFPCGRKWLLEER